MNKPRLDDMPEFFLNTKKAAFFAEQFTEMGIGTILLLGLLGLIVVFLVVGYMLPTERIAKEELHIPIEPEALFLFVSRIANWKSWRPMPEMLSGKNIVFTGEMEGIGGKMSWTSEKESGFILITGLLPDRSIDYQYSLGSARGMIACSIEIKAEEKGTLVVSRAVLHSGKLPAARILTWMMEPVVKKDLRSSLERLRLVVSNE